MIQIGLTGWGGHVDLYPTPQSKRNKLQTYSSYYPIVELENAFHSIQPVKNAEKWAAETPAHFSFLVKAYQGMTGHTRGNHPFENTAQMFDAFLYSIQPLIAAGKLKAVLFQYPPWFECNRANVDVLRYTKEKMGDLPLALEFRNQTWFTPQMRDKTLSFMEREGWIHSICDEPQVGTGSVPTVLHATSSRLTVVRFHGRNVEAWNTRGDEDWRSTRYLYRYSIEELTEWRDNLLRLQAATEEICIIFNNNSGGDAASNAMELMDLLGIAHKALEPPVEQINLFEM